MAEARRYRGGSRADAALTLALGLSPLRRIRSARAPRWSCILARMSDSVLDQALRFCHVALLEMCDTPTRRHLQARLGVLERAAWAIPLVPATAEQVVSIVKLVLDLRDDVVRAQADDERFARARRAPRFADDSDGRGSRSLI
ncbi:MAG: hypothetical protein KIS78_22500 [Labilithrix sp.]|nr:hypothetical protein [Labilithrix sp.]